MLKENKITSNVSDRELVITASSMHQENLFGKFGPNRNMWLNGGDQQASQILFMK